MLRQQHMMAARYHAQQSVHWAPDQTDDVVVDDAENGEDMHEMLYQDSDEHERILNGQRRQRLFAKRDKAVGRSPRADGYDEEEENLLQSLIETAGRDVLRNAIQRQQQLESIASEAATRSASMDAGSLTKLSNQIRDSAQKRFRSHTREENDKASMRLRYQELAILQQKAHLCVGEYNAQRQERREEKVRRLDAFRRCERLMADLSAPMSLDEAMQMKEGDRDKNSSRLSWELPSYDCDELLSGAAASAFGPEALEEEAKSYVTESVRQAVASHRAVMRALTAPTRSWRTVVFPHDVTMPPIDITKTPSVCIGSATRDGVRVIFEVYEIIVLWRYECLYCYYVYSALQMSDEVESLWWVSCMCQVRNYTSCSCIWSKNLFFCLQDFSRVAKTASAVAGDNKIDDAQVESTASVDEEVLKQLGEVRHMHHLHNFFAATPVH